MMTVRVAVTTTHKTVFIIAINKENKQFFSFKATSYVKIFGLQKISDIFFVEKFFCSEFFALNVFDVFHDN